MPNIIGPKEYCTMCPLQTPARRGGTFAAGTSEARGVAADCGGPWYIMRGAVVTTIAGDHEVRPTGYMNVECGRQMKLHPPQAGTGEHIAISHKPNHTHALIVSGPDAERVAGNTQEQDEGIVDEVWAALNRGASVPGNFTPAYNGELVGIPGGGDVAYVKSMVGRMVHDGFIDRLMVAAEVVAHAHTAAEEGFSGSQHAAAAAALALISQVCVELGHAIDHELTVRAEGQAYIQELG